MYTRVKTLVRAMEEQRGGIQSAAFMMRLCAIVVLLLAITGLLLTAIGRNPKRHFMPLRQ